MTQIKRVPNIENVITNINQEKEKINLAFVDCSGSIKYEDFQAFLSEILNFKNAFNIMGKQSEKFMIVFADHSVKGEPIEVNEVNITQYMNGRLPFLMGGGSDLSNVIKQATQLNFFKDKKINSLLCFTDLLDNPPKFKDLGLSKDTLIAYIAAPTTTKKYQEVKEKFTEEVKDYAKVVNIGEGVEVIVKQNNNISPYKSKI
jgi:predicted metal-dependent peptidase